MYNIQADTDQNLLLLHLEGFMTDQELKEAAQICIEKINKLTSGFSIINDISKLKPATPIGAAEIKRVQSIAAEQGAAKIIRITHNIVTKMQFHRTSREVGYQAFEVSTMDEAIRLL